MKNGKDKECKSGEKQRFRCKKCNRRFGDNLGFERRQTAAVFITMALLLNGMGLGPFRIRVALKHMNVDVHAGTIARWLEHYVGLVEKYTSPIQPPNLGSALGADEKRRDVKGEENYVMAMCIDTRFIPAWCTTACKQSHDATKLLKAAVAKAGKPYPILITDGLAGYHTAFEKVFGSLKGFFMHIRDIHIRHEFANTNRQEMVNSTFAGHTGPGHKQRELAGLPHLPAALQLRPAAQRNRGQDSGRGCRHHDTGPGQVADAYTERRRRDINPNFHAVLRHSGRTLPKTRPKTPPTADLGVRLCQKPTQNHAIRPLSANLSRFFGVRSVIFANHPALREESATANNISGENGGCLRHHLVFASQIKRVECLLYDQRICDQNRISVPGDVIQFGRVGGAGLNREIHVALFRQ